MLPTEATASKAMAPTQYLVNSRRDRLSGLESVRYIVPACNLAGDEGDTDQDSHRDERITPGGAEEALLKLLTAYSVGPRPPGNLPGMLDIHP